MQTTILVAFIPAHKATVNSIKGLRNRRGPCIGNVTKQNGDAVTCQRNETFRRVGDVTKNRCGCKTHHDIARIEQSATEPQTGRARDIDLPSVFQVLKEFDLASIFVGTGSRAVFAGRTNGSGILPGGGTEEFGDSFSPGDSPGVVSFGGDVVLGSGSTTLIELGGLTAGAQHDQLEISGTVNLNGTHDRFLQMDHSL